MNRELMTHAGPGFRRRPLGCRLVVAAAALLGGPWGPTVARADYGQPPHGPAPATVRLQSASSYLPVMAAFANGYFADENLTVLATQYTSSKLAFQDMNNGDAEILITAADNAVNYRLNTTNALGTLIDSRIIFGNDLGLGLAVVAQPQYATWDSLRGLAFGIDTPDSGYTMALKSLSAIHGLVYGVDYGVVSIGGSPSRLAALEAGTVQGTIINADSIVRATFKDHFPVLGTISEIARPYAGGVGVARAAWLAANPDVASRFIRALVRGFRWVREPGNRCAAAALVIDDQTPADLAAAITDAAVDDPTGLVPDARLSIPGLLNVVEIRDHFGGFTPPQPDLPALVKPESRLYDLRYWRRAVGSGPDAGDYGGDDDLHWSGG